eukprot:2011976-Amphidinium_carterae.1
MPLEACALRSHALEVAVFGFIFSNARAACSIPSFCLSEACVLRFAGLDVSGFGTAWTPFATKSARSLLTCCF